MLRHALKRLKKASKWAHQLVHLCEVFGGDEKKSARLCAQQFKIFKIRADERTRIEANAYASWMKVFRKQKLFVKKKKSNQITSNQIKSNTHFFPFPKGLLAREQSEWREATDAFFLAQTVFAKLAQVGDADQRSVAQGRADNIAPLVAYTAYRLGNTADRATMDKALLGKLDAYMAASAQEQAKQQTVSWEGRDIEIPSVASAVVTRARFEVCMMFPVLLFFCICQLFLFH